MYNWPWRFYYIEDTIICPQRAYYPRLPPNHDVPAQANLGNAGLIEIEAIHAALARIKKGTYGICARCESEIAQERLNVVPHAALCRNCAREIVKKR